jgi:hypothetical protein
MTADTENEGERRVMSVADNLIGYIHSLAGSIFRITPF